MFGGIVGAVSGALNPKFCFVAGTLVMTKQGYKAIEEIKKGDQVLSFNSNLGLYDYKDVVDVYVNETSKLCHLKTKNDEIICTPNHSILPEKGWMLARDIKTGDNIKTKDGLTVVVSIQIETLSEITKVYNFNVLGYHTYVIGNELAVVHNDCNAVKQGATEKVKYNYNGNKNMAAYNTKGRERFYSVDKSGHGNSVYKGFKLSNNKKKLEWIGDFDENFVKIIGKHKSDATKVFEVIKIISIK